MKPYDHDDERKKPADRPGIHSVLHLLSRVKQREKVVNKEQNEFGFDGHLSNLIHGKS